MALAVLPFAAHSQTFPSKPIRIVVPFPAGLGPDVEMREVAQRLSSSLGQAVIVDNRPGANGRVAAEMVIRSAPDGYTLLLTTPTTLTAEYIYPSRPYDSRVDLTPVSLVSTTVFGLYVSAESKHQNLADFVREAKEKPGSVTNGILGNGGAHHLMGAWFGDVTGAKLRFITYQSSPPYTDAAAGRIDSVFESVLPVLGLIKGGKLRPLAVSGNQRHRQLPDVPTFKEAGYADFNPIAWSGLTAPGKTPKAAIDRISAAVAEIVRSPDFVRLSEERSRNPIGSSPEEFASFLEQERTRWSSIITRHGIRAD